MRHLKTACGTWNGALSAPFAFLCTIRGISVAAASAVAAARPDATSQLLRRLDDDGGFALTPDDPDFPIGLADVEEPPPLLFGQGNRALLTWPAVAVVGTRHPSSYGVSVARTIARIAAEAGLVVVSGMARGLDAVAHWAAVNATGATIGVLGNGLGVIYPAANGALYQRVSRDGLLLTEHPPGERPNAGSFPRRNRLISGLARATVVVEAADRSGALLTADLSLKQGRDVFGVPGPITSRTSAGVNRLIRDGAFAYLEPEDLLCRYPEVSIAFRAALRNEDPALAIRAQLREDLRRVFDALDGAPRTIDGLAEELRIGPNLVLQAISELEIVGLVEKGAGAFRRIP